MSDHRRSAMAPRPAIGQQGTRATHVVGVPVGVDDGVHRVGRPGAQGLGDRLPGEHPRGIEHRKAVARVDCDRVAERLDQGHSVGQLGQLVGDPVGRIGGAGVDDAGGQLDRMLGHVFPRRSDPHRFGGDCARSCRPTRRYALAVPPQPGDSSGSLPIVHPSLGRRAVQQAALGQHRPEFVVPDALGLGDPTHELVRSNVARRRVAQYSQDRVEVVDRRPLVGADPLGLVLNVDAASDHRVVAGDPGGHLLVWHSWAWMQPSANIMVRAELV